MAKKKPLAAEPIITKALPRICPACAHQELGRVETFGVWRLTCQACQWTERYRVRP